MTKTLLILFCLLVGMARLDAQVAIIANKSVPVDSLTKSELLDLYLLDVTRWQDGKPVVVKGLKQKGEVKDSFYNYLGKSSSRVKTVWLAKMLAGEADPPETLKSEREMLATITSTAGAIGFLSTAKTSDSVKVLLIIN